MRAGDDLPARPGSCDGGLVKGPGTGISDSIPRDMRKGSFIMPADSTAFFGQQALARLCSPVPGVGSHADCPLTPEQVYTVGWNVLDAMRRGTHTPAVLQSVLPQHRNGRRGFDNGTLQNPLQPSAQADSSMPPAGSSAGLGTNYGGSGTGAFGGAGGGSVPQMAAPAVGSGSISNPAAGSAASQALAAASRPYAGSPNGQLTANQLRVMQGLATNDSQERTAQLSSQTSQNNAALQAETQMAQLDANNQQFQQRLAAAKAMRDPQNLGTPFQW